MSFAHGLALTAIVATTLIGCGAVKEIKSELQGTAGPTVTAAEPTPVTKSFGVKNDRLVRAVQETLDEQGYIYEFNKSSGVIRTEPKWLDEPSKFKFVGASYAARLHITVRDTAVTFRARFNKRGNLVENTDDREFPEKENELRYKFFAALDQRLR